MGAGDLSVTSCSGQAKAFGVEEGDIIVALEGVSVRGLSAEFFAREAAKCSRPCAITFLRHRAPTLPEAVPVRAPVSAPSVRSEEARVRGWTVFPDCPNPVAVAPASSPLAQGAAREAGSGRHNDSSSTR